MIIVQLFSLCACYNETLDTNDTVMCTETEDTDIDSELVGYDTHILNTNSKKIHKITCGSAKLILPENRQTYNDNISKLYDQGYSKCGNCFK